MLENISLRIVAAYVRGEKFAPRPPRWEQPLPHGTHAIEDLREACERLGLRFPIPEYLCTRR